MIFHRRVIQKELDNLRKHLRGFEVDRFVKRLNAADHDRLSTMWEVLVVSALCETGTVEIEKEISGGRRPDVNFLGDLNFVAEITSISDQGIEDRNPVSEFTDEVERVKSALGMPIGGVSYRIESFTRPVASGSRVDLRLPSKGELQDFVDRRIAPEIERQKNAGADVIRIDINDEEAELVLVIDPSKGPYSSGSYPSFDVVNAIDRNPLFDGLVRKVAQLEQAPGLTGIFVCDNGTSAIRERGFGTTGFSPSKIIGHFLREHRQIDFVMALSVWQQQPRPLHWGKLQRRVDVNLFARQSVPQVQHLKDLRDKLAARLPSPRATGDNGRRQANADIHRWGFHGGYSMSNRSVKISLREMTEILAGRMTVESIRARHPQRMGESREFPDHFERMLGQGRLPVSASVVPGEPEDDDWIEFTFGDPDPAISPFR